MTQFTAPRRNKPDFRRQRATAVAVLAAGYLALTSTTGCTNPEVPAGHEGYIHQIPLLFGKMSYTKSLAGPASTGVSWRAFTINIDMRERNYPEKFELLSQDDLHVSFEVNTRIRLRPGTVKDIVERWGSAKWYEWNVKEPLRTIVRREVMKVKAADIQLKTDRVGRTIKESLREKYKDTPFDIQSVDIGSFEFPAEVDKAIQEKIAKQQELERQDYILKSTEKEASIAVFEALKVNKRQRIIAETLDPLYVQWAAVQVYRKLAASPNNTVIMLPNTADGTGVPQIMSGGKRKPFAAEDDAELARIEAFYRNKVKKDPPSETHASDKSDADQDGDGSGAEAPDGSDPGAAGAENDTEAGADPGAERATPAGAADATSE